MTKQYTEQKVRLHCESVILWDVSYPQQEILQVANRISAYVYIQEGTQSPIIVLVCKAGRTQTFAVQS